VSNPYLIGTANAALGSTTLVLTPATPSAANDVIHVAANTNAIGQTITGVTDTKGNTYAVINSDTAQLPTYEFETTGVTIGLSVSDTITITYSSTSGAKEAIAIGLPGVTPGHDSTGTPTPVDGAGALASTITSGTLSQANEVVLAIVSTGNQSTGPAFGSGFTALGSTHQGFNQWLTVGFLVVSSTAAVTATATWGTSVKYCALMTSFQIPSTPPPSGLYLVGQASAAPGGSTQLSVPVTGSITQGDTITVGVLATAGSVTGVSDNAGNSYALVQSETVTPACQLYTFESYNSNPVFSGTSSSSTGKFGNTADYRNYTMPYGATNASPCVFTNIAATASPAGFGSTAPYNGTAIKLSGGTAPGGFTNGTQYYVVRSSASTLGTTFSLAASPGGAPINSSSIGSGSQTFTIGNTESYSATSASPCVFTNTATPSMAPPNDSTVQLATGTAPTGFSNGTTYFVVSSSYPTGTTFSLAATKGGTPINSSSTGSGSQTFTTPDATTTLLAAQLADAILGFPAAASAAGSQKLYMNPGFFPTSLTTSNGQDYTDLLATGTRVWLCYKPNPDGSDLTAFQNSLTFWKNQLGASRIRVILHQEYGNLSQADFIAVYHAYAPMIHGLGLKIVYNAAGSQEAKWVSWYPGNASVDEIAIDYYGTAWSGQTHGGTTNLDPTLPMRQLADSNGKPFGFGELGQGVTQTAGNFLSKTLFTQYMTYITTMMGGRLAQGLHNSDVMWYNGLHGSGGNTILPGDWRVPLLTAMGAALTGPSTPAAITVTYSGTVSAQAAIAVGDSNVQGAADKIVGATATSGTTASVATGALTQSAEHIIAFFADLNAGGIPLLGDGLTAASTGLSLAAGRLKAGFKAVSTTASDTPSATIVSTTWAVSAVTHALNGPVIQNPPGTAFVGQPFSFTATTLGGTGTLTYSSSGALPPGLTFTSAGVLLGTPTTAGTYPYVLIVTDSLGLQGTISVTQQIIQPAPPPITGTTPPTHLEGNILSYADSDSEGGAGYTWTAFSNATTPAPSTIASVAGANSTAWQAIVAGDTQIITGNYPVVGSEPYLLSTFLFANQNLLGDVGIVWFDNTGTQIASIAEGNSVNTVPGGWTPLSFATVSPSGAVTAALIVTAHGASAGQSFAIDLSFLTQSHVQILIDWSNPAFAVGGSAGQLFMDVSPFVRFDQNITYTRGRQDALSQIQAGSASFQLQNDLGTFTRLSTTSIPASIGGTVSLQRRCQINLADQGGVWWTRFDGSISEIGYGFDNTGNTSIATITLTDVLSGLNRQDPLFCWTKEQVLADGPLYHWSLDDPGNTGGTGPAGLGAYGTAAETSGSNGPPMRLLNTDSTKVATAAWQDTTGGIETLADSVGANQPDGSEYWTPGLNQPSNALRGLDSGTVGPFTTPLGSVYLTPVLTAQSLQNQFVGNNGYYLQAELPVTLGTNDPTISYAFEVYFTMDPAIGSHLSAHYGPYIQLSLGSSRQKACVVAGLFLNSGALQYEAANYNQPPAFLGLNWAGVAPPSALTSTLQTIPPDTIQRPHHLVLNMLGGSPGTMYAYLDGVLIGSFALTAGQVFDTITVGAAYGGAGAHFGGVQLASIYPQALSPQQITMHCQLGQYGMWEAPSDDALTQVASYANVPSFWFNLSAQHNGLTLMEYMDITGANALTAMQLNAQAENGLLYVAATGALNFHTRDWRMGYGAPDLYLPPGTFDADMNYGLVDQFMSNEAGVAGPGTTGASGTQGASLSAATGSVQQPTDTVASATVQAGYINSTSQDTYGVYATNPVSSPISLPLITWSRAYAQLGIPSLSYWADPNLIDVASWTANSRSDPWLFPAQLTIDLLTLDALITVTDSQGNVSQTQLGISDFYALEIDNMVAPSGTLAPSFPNMTGSLEWFIEGISETTTNSSRILTLYVSPAETQRAWIPGDAVYGVLGSTTRLGISQSDLSTPQADGKDVAHDAGPPYWPPTFSNTLNNPDGSGNAFIGAQDMRGIVGSLQLALQPPMCSVSAIRQTQSFASGALSNPAMNWDTINVDTAGGMGLYPGWPNWYVCVVPGFYELSGSVVWAQTASQSGYAGQGWFAIAQQAAQALAAGTGTPLTVGQYVCPVGESVRFNASSMNPVCAGSTRVYLGLGDMVALCAEHNYTSSRGTSTSPTGSMMSIRFVGLSTSDDRTQINSSIASGGTVTINPGPTPGSFTYTNQHTYSYQGQTGFRPYGRRNSDSGCYQGVRGHLDSEGSQTSQIQFNAALMASQLSGHTLTSATLTCTNLTSYYDVGTKLMLGYTTVVPGGLTYHPQVPSSTINVFHQQFKKGQELSFALPISMVQPFVTGGATALLLGDSVTTNLNYYGSWLGGPGNWILKVHFK
jgi:hypothetical protein